MSSNFGKTSEKVLEQKKRNLNATKVCIYFVTLLITNHKLFIMKSNLKLNQNLPLPLWITF